MNPSELVKLVTEFADDKRAEDIVILKMEGLTLIADYFVICTGTTGVHTKAISAGIEEGLKDMGHKVMRRSGYEDGIWVVLDFGSVVVHILQPEARAYYDLERLWGDARRVSI